MRAFVTTPQGKSMKFNGATCKVLAIMDALRRGQRPLRVEDITDMTPDDGVLMTSSNEKVEVSGILCKLKEVGAVYNPVGVQAPTRHYCLQRGVKVEVTFD